MYLVNELSFNGSNDFRRSLTKAASITMVLPRRRGAEKEMSSKTRCTMVLSRRAPMSWFVRLMCCRGKSEG